MERKKRITDDARNRKVQRAVSGVLAWLGASQTYKIVLRFVRDLEEGHRKDAAATVDEDYPYREITITFVRHFVDAADKEELEMLVLHELLHVLIFGPIGRFVGEKSETMAYLDLEESAVDMATWYILRLKPKTGFPVPLRNRSLAYTP